MARTKILIDYDLETGNITRIIHPEDDSHIVHHHEEPGWGRIVAHRDNFPIHDGKPTHSLAACADEVERVTGKRPPNAP